MKSINRSLKTQKSFTLIELLVVISVIAILLAILLPSLSKAKEIGRRTACLSQLRQVMIAFTAYADDFEGHIADGFDGGTPNFRTCQNAIALGPGNVFGVSGQNYWGPGLLTYVGYLPNKEVHWCPNRTDTRFSSRNNSVFGINAWPIHALSAYIHRNNNILSGLGYEGLLSKNYNKSWIADSGFFYNQHQTRPQYSRYWNHKGGFNVGYMDGAVLWYSDPKHQLWSNVDGGKIAWPIFDSYYNE